MPAWDAIEAYEKGYADGLADGRRRQVAEDIKQRRTLPSLSADRTALVLDWAEARRARRLPSWPAIRPIGESSQAVTSARLSVTAAKSRRANRGGLA